MDDFSLQRFFRLAGITLLLAVIIYVVLLFIFAALHIEMPQFFSIVIALFGGGLIVYKFFADRV